MKTENVSANHASRGNRANHFDVVIIGAGISGIGSACHLLQNCAGMSFVILDERETFGGTWDSHRYPGVRCDTDFSVYSYSFKPWYGKPMATGQEILEYLGEVVRDHGLNRHIRFQHRVLSAAWSDEESRWTLTVTSKGSGEKYIFTAGFLWMCQGYFRQDRGHMPEWQGTGAFKGRIVHAQEWPEDLDYKGKKLIVVGSGATAATLVPALANECEHVTMLQRSPTYFRAGTNANALAQTLRELKIDETWIHEIVRRKWLHDANAFVKRTFAEPEATKQELIDGVKGHLGDHWSPEHFVPHYRPWQQRVALVPDGDLFTAIKSTKATVVTDEIETFTATGVRLKSGKSLTADIVVAATGFNLQVMGDMDFFVNGNQVNFAERLTYRGMMINDVPNMAFVFGYFRLSWTPRVHLVADFVCRLLRHMRSRSANSVSVSVPLRDREMKVGPFVEADNLNSGYLGRSLHLLFRSGEKPEWKHSQDLMKDMEEWPKINLDDEVFVYNTKNSQS